MSYTMKTNLSKKENYGNQRSTSNIKYIVLHYTANDGDSDEANGKYFHNNVVKASAHYFVDDDSVTQSVPDDYVAYSVGGKKYNDVAKTGGGKLYGVATNANTLNIEMCDTKKDGVVMATEQTMANAAELCKTLMEKYNVSANNVIRHFDVNGKHCPAYFMDEAEWSKFKKRLEVETKEVETKEVLAENVCGKDLTNLTNDAIIVKMGPLFTEDQRQSGVLASVSFAQFILESSYGKSELGQNANNCFGMKKNLSGNTWAGSVWDGSVYSKKTSEFENGQYVEKVAEFRKYPTINKSIADHSAYLTGAMNGSKKRYEGLKGCTDYRKSFQIIKDGGYATSPDYVDKLCNVVEKWGLNKYDLKEESVVEPVVEPKVEEPTFKPYVVRVDIKNLNIRKGPGTNYDKTGKFTGIGNFTIVEVSTGKGSKTGWGKLKSGAGWISLDFTSKL